MLAKTVIKLVGGLLGSVAGVGLLYGAYNFVGNYFTEKQNTQIKMCNLRIESEREKFRHEYAEKSWTLSSRTNASIDRIRNEAKAAMAQQRIETNKYKEVVENRDRLDRLARERPDTLTRLATAATNKRWKEIENILADP